MAERYPGGFSPACVDAATIAAFVDGTIDPAGRARDVAHLASCPDCAELVGEVEYAREVIPDVPAMPKGKVLWMRRRGLAAVGGLVAVAASLVVILLNRGSELDPLVAIVGNERPVLARPTGGFHYGPLHSPVRGSTGSNNYQLQAEVARLLERAQQTKAAVDLHAAGVAQLLAGDTNAAIESLQAATRLKPDDATYDADLGAARLARFVERGEPTDSAAAIESLDRALARAPSLKEAWFNKALLLERMNRPADALAAWDGYLKLSDDRGWREEATRSRDELQRRPR
jgi:hypothetical protein